MTYMYKTPSKRSQLNQRVVVYSAMTIGVVVLVTFLVFIMLGYRFNRDTSSIQQGGLVQFASRPIDASVTVGNAKLTDLTPSKITMNPGTYDVKMSKKGYQDWTKNVDVRSGEVLWLNYTQLVPNNVATEALTTFDAIAGMKSSPNGDRYVLLADAAKPTLEFIDVTGNEPKRTTFAIPATSLPQDKTVTLTLGDWASDSDRLFIKADYEGGSDWLVIDRREVDRTVNLSKTYQSDIAEVTFDPRTSEKVIVRTAKGEVRSIDTSAKSLSGVIASNVTSMSIYGNDAILTVRTLEDGGQSVGYVSLGSTDVRELKRVDSTERTFVAAASYFSEPYIAVVVGSKLEVMKARSLPSSESKDAISMSTLYSTTLPAPSEFLSIRASGRFVFTQYAGGVQTYDIELGKQTVTSFTTPLTQEVRWLDKYHFYLTNGTNLEVMEFDGGNAHAITPLTTTFDAVQSDDGTFIYSVNSRPEGGFVLQRSRMILR